jgi:hypothetical protein
MFELFLEMLQIVQLVADEEMARHFHCGSS